MKRILITGANSYIGTSFEKYMAQWPNEYQIDTIDMKDGFWREKSFTGYDSVFHVAGIAHINTKKLDKAASEKYWAVNAELPVEAARKSKNEGVKQFIFLSSMSVYGEHGSMKHPIVITADTQPNPRDIYGRSKLTAEEHLQKLQDAAFLVCILRPPMIYGEGCKGNYQHLEKAAQSFPVFPDIMNQRSMLHIEGLSAFVKKAIDNMLSDVHLPQDTEYVCTSLMVKKIAETRGKKIHLTTIFNPLLRLLSGKLGLVDKVFGSLIYARDL